MILGGRKVVAFVELSEQGSNHIVQIEPLPADGAALFTFGREHTGSVDIWGIHSHRGRRIRGAYQAGELPTKDVEELNRVLRPDEFEKEVDGE